MSQKVQVRFPGGTTNYTYLWTGTMPLKIGDKVVTPPNWVNGSYQTAEVVSLTSNYDGRIESLAGLVDQGTGNTFLPDGGE